MAYQYILLDLDGTLTDPKEGIANCVAYALSSFGVTVEDLDELTKFIGPPLRWSFSNYYGFSEEDAERLVAKYRERYTDIGIFENRLFDGVPEMLRALKSAGKTVALATSKPEIFAKRILEKYGVAQYFDVIVGSLLDGTRDSKNDVIAEVLRQLNLPEEEKESCIMVGDRHHDISGGKAFGLATAGLRLGYAEPGELEAAGADHIAEDIEELTGLLLK